MKKRWIVITVLALVSGGLIWVLASGFGQDPHKVPFMLEGHPAPAFALPTLENGEKLSLEQFKGRPVIINFWASWCQPCKLEYPELESGHAALKDQVTFLGIVHGDTEENARAFLRRFPSSYPQLMDATSGTSVDYGIAGVPETYFIDKAGVIRHKHIGPIHRRQLLAKVRELQP